MDKEQNLIARASVTIDATIGNVWDALVTPEAIKQYMFGTTVVTDWREGSPISWKGEWEGKPYEDKGTILQLKPGRSLQYSHFSPRSGLADTQENYHIVHRVVGRGRSDPCIVGSGQQCDCRSARAFRKELADDAHCLEEVLGALDRRAAQGLQATRVRRPNCLGRGAPSVRGLANGPEMESLRP